MDWGWLTLNLAYVIYTASGVFRDMLRLRVTLLIATVLFLVYGAVAGVWSVFWWNVPVTIVHTTQIAQLWRQRRSVDLDAEAEAIRLLLYPSLSRVAFNRLWHTSTERVVTDEVLIVKGEPVDELVLVLQGELEVTVGDSTSTPQIVQLGRLRFVGEMSMVANTNATATVRAIGDARIRCWPTAELNAVCDDDPDIERAHLRAIGQELTRKLT